MASVASRYLAPIAIQQRIRTKKATQRGWI
jgi:hypothetical protein